MPNGHKPQGNLFSNNFLASHTMLSHIKDERDLHIDERGMFPCMLACVYVNMHVEDQSWHGTCSTTTFYHLHRGTISLIQNLQTWPVLWASLLKGACLQASKTPWHFTRVLGTQNLVLLPPCTPFPHWAISVDPALIYFYINISHYRVRDIFNLFQFVYSLVS